MKKNVKIVNNNEIVNTDFVKPSDQPAVSRHVQKAFCGVNNAWSDTVQSKNDDYLLLNVTTIFDKVGKELKKLLNNGLGKEKFVQVFIQLYSASPVSFLKKNVLHDFKLRDPLLKLMRLTKLRKIFTAASRMTRLRWTYDKTTFFISDGHEQK